MGLLKKIKYFKDKKERIEKLDLIDYSVSIPNEMSAVSLNFPLHAQPKVSIIIPFFNQEHYTWACLKSIGENLPMVSFEIILVDDHSPDAYDFSLVSNITILKNSSNLGFLRSCNKGISQAKGEYIYLLNNDTIVLNGFLDELVAVFNNFTNVGAVGSMLINADNTLQEAGSVLMKNEKIAQIVTNKKTFYPEVNYIYKVDYCSGCSLLFKKNDDNGAINYFDEQFAPAYFEETDMCFRLKYEQGKDTYYTPFSKLIHFNGVSYNRKTDSTPTEKDKLFEKNLSLFKQKWQAQLDAIQSKTVQERILELNNDNNIFFYNNELPHFDKNSGDLRLTEIIKAYKRQGFNVFYVVRNNLIDNPYNEFFQRLGVCVYYEHLPLNDLKKFYKRLSVKKSIAWFYAGYVFYKHYGSVTKMFEKCFMVYDMVDIHHLRFKRTLEKSPNDKFYQRSYRKFLKFERISAEKADLIIPISEEERLYMEKFVPSKDYLVISNIHYVKIKEAAVPGFVSRKDILFVGSKHHPNIDAIYFLVKEILPIVWKKIPDLKLNIIGNVKDEINDIKNDKINFLGFVPDVKDQFLSNRFMVAPVRFGAGVKGKIGQAFEYFLPVVSSTIGAEGMKLTDYKNALIEDDPQLFAEKIIQLYTDENLWNLLKSNSEKSLYPFSIDHLHNQLEKINLKAKSL